MPANTVYSIILKKENAHDDPIYCCSWVNYNPQGDSKNASVDFIATGGLDSYVKVWTLKGDQLEVIHTLQGHTMAVLSVVFSPDIQIIASSSLDSSLILWDLNSGKKFKEIQTGATDVWKVVFSPEGEHIATCGHSGRIVIYNVVSGKLDKVLDTRGKFTTSVAWSPDGKYIATGSTDGILCIMDVVQGKLIHTIQAHKDSIRSVAFSPKSSHIATASYDGHVKIYHVGNASLQNSLDHKCRVLNVCFSPDGSRVASAAADGSVRVALVNGLTVLNTFKEHTSAVWGVQFNGNGTKLLSVSKDKCMNVYECPLPPKPEKKPAYIVV